MRLIILGAGGFGRTVADIAVQTRQYSGIVFLDDNSAAPDVQGKCADFARYMDSDTVFYPAFGNNESRMEWLEKLSAAGCLFPTIIHPSAYVSPSAAVNEGAVVLPGAIVNTGVTVKRGCIVNCGAIIDHGCVVEEGVHVCLGAIIKAENRIPRCMKIEAGEVINNKAYPM